MARCRTRAKFTGKYLVVKIDGELSLGGGRARFKGEDPGFLWRNRAKDYIQGKLEKYLDPKATPADLPTELATSARRSGDRRSRDSAAAGACPGARAGAAGAR